MMAEENHNFIDVDDLVYKLDDLVYLNCNFLNTSQYYITLPQNLSTLLFFTIISQMPLSQSITIMSRRRSIDTQIHIKIGEL